MKKGIQFILPGALLVWSINYIGLLRLVFDLGNDYYYTTAHGEFTGQEDEYKGGKGDLERIERSFGEFRKVHPQTQDTVLYRTFTRNPLKFWYWRDYLTNCRYAYPYLDSADE